MGEPFERVVAAHGDVVWRVCRAVLVAHDAEDAWSETFLAALRAYPGLPEGVDVRAWLVTVARRKAIDVLRARRRRALPAADLPEGELPDRPSVLGLPDQAVEDGGADLWAAVGRLPTRQRQAVAYHHLAGLPYADVAALVGGSTDAARRAAADGVRSLRRTYSTPTSDGGAQR